MNALAFDTHKAVKMIHQAGAEEAVAEAVVATIGTAMGEQMATKMEQSRKDVAKDRELFRTKMEQSRKDAAKDRELFRTKMEQSRKDAAKDRELFRIKMELSHVKLIARMDLMEHRILVRIGTLMVAGFAFLAVLDAVSN